MVKTTETTDVTAIAVAPTQEKRDILRIVAERGASPEEVGKWMDLEIRKDTEAARRAFFQSVVEFQHRMPMVAKGDDNNGRRYAKLERVWNKAHPIMAQCGLAVIWRKFTMNEQTNMCHLEGILTHAAGHYEELVRDMPLPDEVRSQNKCQRAGAANSYAKRYAVLDALGIVCGEDTDGGAPRGELSDEDTANLRELCEAAGKRYEDALDYIRKGGKYETVCKQLAAQANNKGGRRE
jgi:hypothetical protein